MSKTDKTDPYYVKLHRHGVEEHDHRYGVCDYDPDAWYHHTRFFWTRSWCSKRQADYSYCDNSWFAQPKAVREESTRQNRVERRQTKAALRRGDYDNVSTRGTGRGNAKWECC